MFNRQSPCIFPNLKVVFHGIPKNASTSVKNALYILEHGKELPNANKQWVHKGNKKGGSLYPELNTIGGTLFDGWEHLIVVRNPYDRFISFYVDLFLKQAEKRTSLPEFYTHNNINMKMKIDAVLDMISRIDDEHGDEHFISQHSYMHRPLHDMSLIKMETLNLFWARYCQSALHVDPTPLKMYNQSTSNILLSKVQKDIIYERYKQDFEVFRYAH